MPRILLLITTLIIYGSLYPWQFHAAPIPASPLSILLHSWPTQFDRFILKDIPVNIALYTPFGASAFMALRRRPHWLRLTLPVLAAAVLSGSLEMIQIYDAQRVCSLLDFGTNVLGGLLGVVAGVSIELAGVSLPSLAENGSASLYLLLCWLAARTFPFMPDLSRTHLALKWTAFRGASLAPLAAAGAMVEWWVAWRLLRLALGRSRAHGVAPWLLWLVPLRFFVAGLQPTWVDAAAAACAWLLWKVWVGRRRRVDLLLAAALSVVLVLQGLAPFDFSLRPQPFWWVPFSAVLHTDWQTGFAVLLNKVFRYGAAIWLGLAAGVPAVVAIAAAVLVLAGIESVQLYLPQHVAESTDPLLALLLGCILGRMGKPQTGRRRRRVKRVGPESVPDPSRP